MQNIRQFQMMEELDQLRNQMMNYIDDVISGSEAVKAIDDFVSDDYKLNGAESFF